MCRISSIVLSVNRSLRSGAFMKLIYTNPNPLILANTRNLLEHAGIVTETRNEYASSAVGELSAIDTWPELWLTDESDYNRAMHILQPLMSEETQPSWICGHCTEENESSFDYCWKCQKTKPDKTTL